jgi:hypothetical protein
VAEPNSQRRKQNSQKAQRQVQYNGPPAGYGFIDHNLLRFVDPINIQVKIIIDDIAGRSDKNRRQYKQKQLLDKMNLVEWVIDADVKKHLRQHDKDQVLPANEFEKSGDHIHAK